MKLGLFTALMSQHSLDEVVRKIKPLGIEAVELGTGNHAASAHIKLDWLDSGPKLVDFKQALDERGVAQPDVARG
jgi:sugar phosphate isomerase/epimerase